MIFGIGVDIVEIPRFRKALSRHSARLLERGAHAEELRLAPASKAARVAEYWAARFAVKEAFAKALGTGFPGFSAKAVGVSKNAAGKPHLVFSAALSKKLKSMGVRGSQVSITHTGRYAAAFVVLEGGKASR